MRSGTPSHEDSIFWPSRDVLEGTCGLARSVTTTWLMLWDITRCPRVSKEVLGTDKTLGWDLCHRGPMGTFKGNVHNQY